MYKMKNITKSLIALLAIVTFSCTVDDVQDRPVIGGIDVPVLTAPASGVSYVLQPENAAKQIERFTWKSANYGGDIQVAYAVEIDALGNEFKTPQSIGSVIAENQISVSVEQLNNAVLLLGATPFSPSDYEVRVRSTAGAAETMSSEIITIVVTPYTTETPRLWMSGNFLSTSGYGENWALSTSLPSLASSGFGETDYEGFVFINDANAEFKFLTQNTTFDGSYGNATGPDGTNTGLLLQTGGFNAGLPSPKTAGYYHIKVDTDPAKLTYSATRTTWGIIGNGTPGGWDLDTPMTYSPTTKTWTVIATLSTQAAPDNGLKFRPNNDWPGNFGDTSADSKLEVDGTNIGTIAGTYLITLDLSNPREYTYSMVLQ